MYRGDGCLCRRTGAIAGSKLESQHGRQVESLPAREYLPFCMPDCQIFPAVALAQIRLICGGQGWPHPTSVLRLSDNRDAVTYISRAELTIRLGYLAVSF